MNWPQPWPLHSMIGLVGYKPDMISQLSCKLEASCWFILVSLASVASTAADKTSIDNRLKRLGLNQVVML